MSAWVGAKSITGATNLAIISQTLAHVPIGPKASGKSTLVWEIDFSGTFPPIKGCYKVFLGKGKPPKTQCPITRVHSITVIVNADTAHLMGVSEPALRKVVLPPPPTPAPTPRGPKVYVVP